MTSLNGVAHRACRVVTCQGYKNKTSAGKKTDRPNTMGNVLNRLCDQITSEFYLFLTLTFIMKKLFTFVFFLVTFNCFSQHQLQIKETYPDSLSVLSGCKWEKSTAKYVDLDGTTYQVFLDIQTLEVFMIFRKQNKFVKVIFK
jgi:hypothetical protein